MTESKARKKHLGKDTASSEKFDPIHYVIGDMLTKSINTPLNGINPYLDID